MVKDPPLQALFQEIIIIDLAKHILSTVYLASLGTK